MTYKTDNEYVSNDNQFVTVIVCSYNASETIVETLNSLDAQTFDAVKILIIDDGSSDDTVEKIEAFNSARDNIRLIRNDVNRGTAYSRQRGLDEAETDLILFFDADDVADPLLVEKLYEKKSEDNNIIAIGCSCNYFSGDKIGPRLESGPKTPEEFFYLRDNCKLIFMLPPTLFSRLDALRVGGYRQFDNVQDTGIRYQDFSEDVDLWCRLADMCVGPQYMVSVPDSLFKYRRHSGSISSKNIFSMQKKMRWIKICAKARKRGLSEPSFSDYLHSLSRRERLAYYFSDYAALQFRRASNAYIMRNYFFTVFFLAFSFVFDPRLLIRKLFVLKFSRKK